MSKKILILEIAAEYGLNAALVLQHVYGWLQYNEKRGKNLKDGKYWMYQTIKDMSDELQCLTEKQVGNILRKLVAEGVLLKGNYNKQKYDRTAWYTLSDDGWALMRKYSTIDDLARDHACYREATPIPINNNNNIQKKDVDIDDDNDEEMDESGSHEVVYYQQIPVLKSDISKITQLVEEIWEDHYPANKKITKHDMCKAVQYVTEPHTFSNGDYVAIYCPSKAAMLQLAFVIAHDNNGLNWKYIDEIFYKWGEKGINNLDAYERHEKARYREKHCYDNIL